MSYADMAKKGPPQADEDSRFCDATHRQAPPLLTKPPTEVPQAIPEIAHSDSGVHSLDSLSTSSYADQQKAEEDAQRAAQEAKDTAKKTADRASKDARAFMAKAEGSASELESKGAKKYQQFTRDAKQDWDRLSKDAQAKYNELANEAEKGVEKAKVQGKKGYKEAKEEGKEAEEWAEKNKGNPVVIGNAVVIAALGGVLGTSAYRMHKAGTLTWNVIGAWAGVVGLFAVGDYYVSQWFFKNKYPTK